MLWDLLLHVLTQNQEPQPSTTESWVSPGAVGGVVHWLLDTAGTVLRTASLLLGNATLLGESTEPVGAVVSDRDGRTENPKESTDQRRSIRFQDPFQQALIEYSMISLY